MSDLWVTLSFSSTETRRVCCVLQLLRKIYLYLQFDAFIFIFFHPVWTHVTAQQEEGARMNIGVSNYLQTHQIKHAPELVIPSSGVFSPLILRSILRIWMPPSVSPFLFLLLHTSNTFAVQFN